MRFGDVREGVTFAPMSAADGAPSIGVSRLTRESLPGTGGRPLMDSGAPISAMSAKVTGGALTGRKSVIDGAPSIPAHGSVEPAQPSDRSVAP